MRFTYRALNETQASQARIVRLIAFAGFMGLGIALAVIITLLGLPYGIRPSGWPWAPADWYGVWLGLLLAGMLGAGAAALHFHRLVHVDVLIRRKTAQLMRHALPLMLLSIIFGIAGILVLLRLGMVSWSASGDNWRTSGPWVWTSPRLSEPIVNVAFAADGQTLFVWLKSGTVRAWLVGRGKEQDAANPPLCPLSVSSSLAAEKNLTAAGVVMELTSPGELKVKFKDGRSRNVISVGDVTCLALSGDGDLALIGAKGDGTVEVWNTAIGSQLPLLKSNKQSPVASVALSFDKQEAASGQEDGRIRFWSMKNSTILKDGLKEHDAPVRLLAFDNAGNRLASLAPQPHKSLLVLWDAKTFKALGKMETPFAGATHLAVAPDGRHVAVVADSFVHLLRLPPP